MQGGCHSMPPLQAVRAGTIGKKPSSEGTMSQTKIALDDHGGGAATIFYGNKCWKRVPGEGPDATAKWWNKTPDHVEAADSEKGRILEHAYQHQETTEPVHRYPREESDLKLGQPVYCSAFR